MQNSFSKLVNILDNNLGRCPTCMKTAFVCAFISWFAVAAVEIFWPAGVAGLLVFLVAIGFSVLWTLHFTTYTARVLAALWSEYIGNTAPLSANGDGHAIGRRDLLWVCANALGIAVIATVWLPTSAFGQGQQCGKGRCPDDAKNCCSRSQGICCDGNWACTKTRTCHPNHTSARAKCGKSGIVWACG